MGKHTPADIAILFRQTRILDRLERPFAREIRAEKNRFIQAQADNWKFTRMLSADLVTEHRQRILVITRKHAKRAIRVFSGESMRSFPKSARSILESKDLFDDLLMEWVNTHGAEKAIEIAGTTMRDMRNILRVAIAAEEPANQIIQSLLRTRGLSPHRAATIARTETHNAAMFASQKTAEALSREVGLEIFKKWIPALDERTRFTHAAMIRHKAIPMDQKFLVGGERLDRPGDPSGSPGNIINCLHPDTKVWFASPNALTRRFYKGVMIRIQTANGNNIAVTPNHPILTGRGWVFASEIKKTDSIICADRKQWKRLCNFDIQNVIPAIEKVYNSARVISRTLRVSGVGVDFHGEIPDKHVDVIFENRRLLNNIKSFFCDPLAKFIFPHADFAAGLELSKSLQSIPLCRSFIPSPGIVGSRNLFSSFLFCFLRPFKQLSFASVPWLNTVCKKPPINGSSIAANNFRNSFDRNAGVKELYNLGCAFVSSVVVSHDEFQYSGYVYNLSDDKQYSIGNGIVNHNCRCVTINVPPE